MKSILGQGGKFDHADRLFQSIDGTYRNCLSNTSDVKELIPEFFYMPEFLVNLNSYHLGVKQDGEPLGDVALPPWAKVSVLIKWNLGKAPYRANKEKKKREKNTSSPVPPHGPLLVGEESPRDPSPAGDASSAGNSFSPRREKERGDVNEVAEAGD
ncbi:hypothetical protein GW17_00027567 [Ensete ventricosum]|nr:hypothetical protein GW17_00027567 [Ensete ventricosum]